MFTEEDSVITSIQFSKTLQDTEDWPQHYENQMILSIMSFVRAQEEYNPFSDEFGDMINSISSSPFEDFQFALYGIEISCD